MKILFRVLFFQCFSLMFAAGACANPEPVVHAVEINGTVATLSGRNFGALCRRCQVVADFKGHRYALPVRQWDDHKIVVDYFDFGWGLISTIIVLAADGVSESVDVAAEPVLVGATEHGKYLGSEEYNGLKVYTRKYNDSMGGKGADQFDVSSNLPRCGELGLVFEQAEVVVGRRTRFGEAKIVSAPAASCVKCDPVKIGYYWEPTGRLDYQLQVVRRQVAGVCADRIR